MRLYSLRMWIEEMFADLESSHLRSPERLERLTLLVCLLYLWLLVISCRVDRHDRRDLSLFRLGWDFIERCLALADPIPILQPPEPLFSVR